ncbi:L,D-transpeptidase [Cohnella hashimotonis]|uniref:L,D-transpeptidase n=1 Tax=Cohnella hashimotonis TaxID=2826895 RepID=A0ABT6TDP2_9BACL|nr:L,D-transpeptidase [Cohnella hashimotonis]MDI4644938.1 L,D-transpeptidase [Cohnella hashimotonis]
MSNDDRLEEQIKQFYELGPDVHDALPIKDYLLKHGNNQMAWYLLGKEYLSRGQEAKANYCFAQAGPVYEAFESKKSPQLNTGEGAAGLGNDAKTGSGDRRRAGWIAAAAGAVLLALGVFVYAEQASAPEKSAFAGGEQAAPSAQTGGQPSQGAASPTPNQAGAGKGGTAAQGGGGGGSAKPAGLMAAAAERDGAGQAILGNLLTAQDQAGPSLLFKSPRLGKWIDWVKAGAPIAQVAAPADRAAASVDWYDSGWCPCGTAQDAKPTAARIAAWKPLQESKLVLRSAMIAYKQRTGKWPASPKNLAAAYPANTMSGWNAEQTAWFGELSDALAAKTAPAGAQAGWPNETGPAAGNGTPAGELASLAEQPIEIVIDKTRHRLAVISGGVLLRNYEVGLGAKDTPTPEGTFVITEKVRNPNGSATGAFGSRGMTLSDTLYAIHGTDEPSSVGKDESHGCARMNKEDVEELFDLVQIGTKVTISKGGLPVELRAPEKRFKLKPAQNETNPSKKYEWLN